MIAKHYSKNLEDTLQLSKQLAKQLKAPDLISLEGDLGVGKTAFTKGLAAALGYKGEVSSPSFTIMNIYDCSNELEVHHYDFYRLNDAEIISQQLQESVNQENVITVVEWATQLGAELPKDTIIIKMAYDENPQARNIKVIE